MHRRPRRLLICVAAVAAVLTIGPDAQAQTPADEGTLIGTVEDATGARIPGATLVLRSDRSPLLRVVEASGRGQFEIVALPAGSFTLTTTAPGFAAAETTGTSPGLGTNRRRLDARRGHRGGPRDLGIATG